MRPCLVLWLAAALAACGAAAPSERAPQDRGTTRDRDDPFAAPEDFAPVAFGVRVSGHGRPVILIPGLGCPGAVWDSTVAHLGEQYETHVLTLAGFAGRPAIGEPLSAAVRRDLTRYIRSRRLREPILFGHSMGGFIAYWMASYHPELVGPVIIVDAGPALSGDLDEAKSIRARWRSASADEFSDGMRSAFTGMTRERRTLAPVLDEVVRSDRRAIGDAIYEMITTDLTDRVKDITAPVLVVAADGIYQQRIRAQIETIPDHEMIVVPRAKHFVMLDAPDEFFRLVDKFLEEHPGRSEASGG